MKQSYGKIKNSKKQNVDAKKITTLSSQMWLKRQLNDIYVKAAKAEGYYARSAYKLIEINQKYKLIKGGDIIVDLGAAPGGWSQVVSKVIKNKPNSKLIAVDLLEVKPVDGAIVINGDFTETLVVQQIKDVLGEQKVNVVLSDMAPNSTGSKSLDHIRIMNLVEIAFIFAKDVLAQNGSFVAKVFQGGTEKDLLAEIKQSFKEVHHFKPPASRKESNEIYLVAKGFRA